jgi:hypothetical protein
MARRTTNFPLPATYGTVITFDVTDVETDTDVLSHNSVTNTSRLTIGETGFYLVGYSLPGIRFAASNQSTETRARSRVRKNGLTVIAGSEIMEGNYYSSSGGVSEDTTLGTMFLAHLSAGDYIEIQAYSEFLKAGTLGYTATAVLPCIFTAIRQYGPRGEVGPAGSGSSINLKDEGISVANTPHTAINFLGDNINVADGEAGVANVTVTNAGVNTNACQAAWQGTGVLVSKDDGWHTFDYDTTIIETDDEEIYHDLSGDSTRIYVMAAGVHLVGFFTEGDPGNNATCSFRILKNGVEQQSVDSFLSQEGVSDTFSNSYLLDCMAGDYLQIEANPIDEDITFHNTVFYVSRVGNGRDGEQGAQGIPGPAGSGGTINVYNGGASVSGTPFEVINLIGALDAADAGGEVVDVTLFGANNQHAESEGESSTTSALWQQKLRLTTPSLPAGDYRIGWSFEYSTMDQNAKYKFRVRLDDTTDFMDILVATTKDYSEGCWFHDGGMKVSTLTAGIHFVDIDYASIGQTTYIRRARLEIWRVA